MILRSIPVARFVIIAVLLLTSVITGAFGVFNYFSEKRQRTELLFNEIALNTEQLATGLALSAWNFDDTQAARNLESTMKIPAIYGVELTASQMNMARERGAHGRVEIVNRVMPLPGQIVMERPITFSGKDLGSVKVFATLKFIEQKLRTQLVSIVAFTILLEIALFLSLFGLLWYTTLEPLREIERYAIDVSSGEGVGAIPQQGFWGELETLRSAIEKMVQQLGLRYEELQKETTLRRKSEERMRLFFERQLVGMAITSPDKRWLQVNDKLCQMLGYAREELTRLTWAELTHPEDLDKDIAQFNRLLAGELDGYNLEKRFVHKEGKLISTNLAVTCVRSRDGSVDYVLALMEDITERKRAEAALRTSEYRFRAIIDASPIPFALNDEQQNITFLNKAFTSTFGYDIADIPTLAHWWPKAYPDAEYRAWVADEWRKHMDKAEETGAAFDPMEVNIRCKDGTERITMVSATALGEQQRGLQLVVLCDITKRKLMEENFLRSQRLEAIGTLASGVAHDLNNILAPILLSAEMLHMTEDAETRKRLISSIEECATRGASVVNQVLTFARGAKGERTTLQLKRLVDDMENIARQTFPKNISITSSVPSDLWPVTGDPTQIHQVILNLCINARDAMPEGGSLRLSAENAEIDENFAAMVPDAKAGDFAMLAVSDTGVGIAREIVLKIFDPFFTTKEIGKGTGLGLSTVAGIVRSHGGFVTVKSDTGLGTTFKVFLPRETEGTAEPRHLTTTEIAQEGVGTTILVVDDESFINKTISMVLKNNGYETLTAFDGNEALAVYREHAHEIDLVLTDVMMPEMDGVALTRALKEINPRVKIIASTGQAPENRQGELHALGVDVILHKPYDAKNLLAALHCAIHTGDA